MSLNIFVFVEDVETETKRSVEELKAFEGSLCTMTSGNEWTFDRYVTKGGFCAIFEVNDGSLVAKMPLRAGEESITEMLTEATLTRKFSSVDRDLFAQLVDYGQAIIEAERTSIMIMHKAVGDLASLSPLMSIETKVYCYGQLLKAVVYVHHEGYLHRDIKGGNALVYDDGRVVLSDFGGAVPIDDVRDDWSLGTTGYRSLWARIGGPYGSYGDLQSVGMMMAIEMGMLSCTTPFSHYEWDSVLGECGATGNFGLLKEMWGKCSQDSRELLVKVGISQKVADEVKFLLRASLGEVLGGPAAISPEQLQDFTLLANETDGKRRLLEEMHVLKTCSQAKIRSSEIKQMVIELSKLLDDQFTIEDDKALQILHQRQEWISAMKYLGHRFSLKIQAFKMRYLFTDIGLELNDLGH